MKIPDLTGWMPIRVYWEASGPMVDWCYLGAERFTDPFFDQTIGRRLRHPFHLLFRHQTPMEVLGEWEKRQPGLSPSGFIFHMSRCGSTLVSQMLAAALENIVISEAGPVDSVLRAHLKNPDVDDAQRAEWLRWLLSALGQPRQGMEKHYFVKFDCWSALELGLIRRVFPETPWVFLYRNPLEVLVSQLMKPASWTVPGMLEPALLKLEATALEMPRDDYCASILARICEVALQHHQDGGTGMLANYQELPHDAWSSLLNFFHVSYPETVCANMIRSAQVDSKNPSMPYVADNAAKSRAATDRMWQVSERWLRPIYERLEAARQASRISQLL